MFQTKVVEKIKTHIFVFSFFPLEKRALCEIVWKKYCRPGQATDDNMAQRFACWIPTATNTHSEYVILPAFSTAITVARTLLDVTLHEQYSACLLVFGMDKQRRCFGAPVFKIQVLYFKYYVNLGLISGCIVTLVHVHSCQQKSIGLKFSKSQTGSDVRYSAIIIRVVLLSLYLRIRAVSLSSIHYNQSHRVYINRRRLEL